MTRIHLKRMASDNFALCGIRPRGSFKLIDTLPGFTPLETASVCKICLKAALGLGQSQFSSSYREVELAGRREASVAPVVFG